jgi:hypothetical protein
MIMDYVDVEVVEDPGDARGVQHLWKGLAQALAERLRKRRNEPGARAIFTDSDERDIVTPVDEGIYEIGQDGLDASVLTRGNVEPRRSNHGDAKSVREHQRTFQVLSAPWSQGLPDSGLCCQLPPVTRRVSGNNRYVVPKAFDA